MDLRFYKSFNGRVKDIIAFITMTYIMKTTLYELHPMDEKCPMNYVHGVYNHDNFYSVKIFNCHWMGVFMNYFVLY